MQMLELDISGQSQNSELCELLTRVMKLPRVRTLGEVDPVKIYLGWTAMPPYMMVDPRCQHALFGPFESRESAEAASALMRSFCIACGTGLIMGDVFTGDGQKLNNHLKMDVAYYLRPSEEQELASQPQSLWATGLQLPPGSIGDDPIF